MILRLQPDQISTMWDVIKFATLQANGIKYEESDAFLNDILASLLDGKMQAWVSFKDEGAHRQFYAISLTCFEEDLIFGTTFMLIHSVYAFQNLGFDLIMEALRTYEQFASINGVKKIVVLTKNEQLVKLYEMIGMQREVFVYSKEI